MYIGKYQPDGSVELGDCLQREYFYVLGKNLLGQNAEMLKPGFEHPNKIGLLRRSPDRDWTGDWNRGSRDQYTPKTCYEAFKGSLSSLIFGHVLRFGFYSNTRRNGATPENHGKQYKGNECLKWWHKIILKYKIPFLEVAHGFRNYNFKLPDIVSPSILGLYLRKNRFSCFVFYLLILILDVLLFFNAATISLSIRKEKDILNYLAVTRTISRVNPTFISNLIFSIEDRADLDKRLDLYFNATEFRPIYDIWDKLIWNPTNK